MKIKYTSDYEPVPEGVYPARLVGIVDMGTQETFYGFKRQIRLTFELVGEEMANGLPFIVQRTYTASMHEKSSFRPVVEALAQRKLSSADLKDGFDIKSVMGAACVVEIEQTEKEGKVFSNIKAISRPTKGTKVPQAVTKPTFLSLDKGEFDEAVFEGLNDKLRDRIRTSPEYEALTAPPPAPRPSIHAELDDGVPF